MAEIQSLGALRALYRGPSGRALKKQIDRLDAHCCRFVSLSPFLVLASAAALVGSLYAAPFLAAVGLLSLLIQRRTGLRFLLAAALTALPLALLTWLE